MLKFIMFHDKIIINKGFGLHLEEDHHRNLHLNGGAIVDNTFFTYNIGSFLQSG